MVMKADFGKAAHDYRQYRHGFPAEFFKRINEKGFGIKGQQVLDIGTGTGTVARGLALLGCDVEAIDPSRQMIEQAKLIDQEAGLNTHYNIGTAEETKQADHSFDLVTAGQCWHWFDAEKAIVEIKRILKPSGKLLIAHYDWIPLKGNVAFLTEELILKYNPAWPFPNGNGFYPKWVTQLSEASFNKIETFSFDVMAEYSHEAWRGRMRASAGMSASHLDPKQVQQFDEELATKLKDYFPNEPLKILHRCFVVMAVM